MFVFDKDGNIAFVDHEHQHSTTHLFKELWSVNMELNLTMKVAL